MNKKIALALIITNIIFLIYSIFLFFYFHHTIFADFSQPEPIGPTKDSVWSIVVAFLNIALYIGLFWVLGAFNEPLFIRGAMLLLIFLKIPALISIPLDYPESIPVMAVFQPLIVTLACIAVLMLLMLLFVRNKAIRGFFKWLVVLMFIALILPSLGGYVYDNFAIRWLLIDRFLLVWASFIPTLLLFIKVYDLSKQKEIDILEDKIGKRLMN